MLNEIQLRYDPRLPRRMNAYAALAGERYQLLVYPVLVDILPPPAGAAVADRYEATLVAPEPEVRLDTLTREHLEESHNVAVMAATLAGFEARLPS